MNRNVGDVPNEQRRGGSKLMPASYDPELNRSSKVLQCLYLGIYQETQEANHSIPKPTIAIDADTGEIEWYFLLYRGNWDLDHPFERIVVESTVTPLEENVSWIKDIVAESRK